MVKKNPPAGGQKRETQVIDATDQALGRLASRIATLLIGKHKPQYLRHLDQGDSVAVKNMKKIKVTGKKMQDKIYFRHSGYPGGLRRTKMVDIFKKDPAEILRRAVYNMLPKNKLRKGRMNRLKIE